MTNTSDAIRGGKQQKIHDALFNLQRIQQGRVPRLSLFVCLFHAARLVVRDFGGQGAPIGVRSLALRSRL